MFSWAEPTGYGLGKSGWVSARFEPRHDVPVDVHKEWIDESYAAVSKRATPKTSSAPARTSRNRPRR
jgi:hypothetical protein